MINQNDACVGYNKFKLPWGNHLRSSEHNASRWFSWYDHAVQWDKYWHFEAAVHSYTWFCDGVSPWVHCPSADTENTGSADSYSTKVMAWNVPCSKNMWLKSIIRVMCKV